MKGPGENKGNHMPKGKILVVDDESAFCKSLTRLLTSAGYDADYQLTAATGLELIKQRGDFDVVISDIAMPGMDGIALLKEIKQFDSTLPVIIVTGYGSDENTKKASQDHAYEFVTKPFTAEKIFSVVERAVAHHVALKGFKSKDE